MSLENPPQTVCTNLSVDVKAELRSIDRDEEDVESRGIVVELGPCSDNESEWDFGISLFGGIELSLAGGWLLGIEKLVLFWSFCLLLFVVAFEYK